MYKTKESNESLSVKQINMAIIIKYTSQYDIKKWRTLAKVWHKALMMLSLFHFSFETAETYLKTATTSVDSPCVKGVQANQLVSSGLNKMTFLTKNGDK